MTQISKDMLHVVFFFWGSWPVAGLLWSWWGLTTLCDLQPFLRWQRCSAVSSWRCLWARIEVVCPFFSFLEPCPEWAGHCGEQHVQRRPSFFWLSACWAPVWCWVSPPPRCLLGALARMFWASVALSTPRMHQPSSPLVWSLPMTPCVAIAKAFAVMILSLRLLLMAVLFQMVIMPQMDAALLSSLQLPLLLITVAIYANSYMVSQSV